MPTNRKTIKPHQVNVSWLDNRVHVHYVSPKYSRKLGELLHQIVLIDYEKISAMNIYTKQTYFLMYEVLFILRRLKFSSTKFTLTIPQAIAFQVEFSKEKYLGTDYHETASLIHQKLV